MTKNEIEQKVSETPLKRDVSPYEIGIYLQKVLKIDVETQTIYRLRKAGRFPSYSKKVGNRSHWFVKKADATKFIVEYASGSNSNKKDPAW